MDDSANISCKNGGGGVKRGKGKRGKEGKV